MLPWLVKPAALVSVLGPLLLSVIRRVGWARLPEAPSVTLLASPEPVSVTV